MKVGLVIASDFAMWRLRKGLIKALVEKGIETYVITPPGPYVDKMLTLGVMHIPLPMYRFFSPIRDVKLSLSLYKIFKKERFDIVHNMTMKPVIYGSIAARAAGVRKIVGLISGMGLLFSAEASTNVRIIRPFIRSLLRLSFSCCHKVWFQNPDDMEYAVNRGLLSGEKAVLIKGSGVDLDEFSPQNVAKEARKKLAMEFDIKDGDKVVTMVSARLIWPKGVAEFLKAGKMLTEKHPGVKFILVAPLEPENPEAVPMDFALSYASRDISVVTNFRDDTKEIMAISAVVVLPSYYKEGVPRVLLEALALGKPVVTADTSGCREVVEDGRNGFLVPARDSMRLAKAIEECIFDEKNMQIFSENSRKKAEKEFDEKDVADRVIKDVYNIIT